MNNNKIVEVENKRKKYCLIFIMLLVFTILTTITSTVLMKLGIIKLDKNLLNIIIFILCNPLTIFLITLTQ